MKAKFKIEEIIILKDNSEWTVIKIIDTSKVKDKLYQAFNMGDKFKYHLKRELTGSIIEMSENTILNNLLK